MSERKLLMIPGPINFEPSVLRVMSTTTPSHVSPTFIRLFGEALQDLKKIFCTNSAQPFVIAGSGTLAMEMAVVNLVEPGDNVLVVSTGYFGERYAEILKRHNVKVDELKYAWGEAAKPEVIKEKLEDKNYKIVTVTHVDTSTGVANDVESIGDIVKDFETLYIVDGVCATAAMPERMDEWGIDVILTASQKAIGVPPGLALLAFSQRALRVYEKRKIKVDNYFMDIGNWLPVLKAYETGQAAYFATPPINLVFALHQSLRLIVEEGIENRFRRSKIIGQAVRSAIKTLGLTIVPRKPKYAADTLTAVHYPNNVNDLDFRKTMADKQGVVVAGGLGKLKEKIFRIGHMGPIAANDVVATVSAIEKTLLVLGYPCKLGEGVASAQKILQEL